jgi:hypothetical protein
MEDSKQPVPNIKRSRLVVGAIVFISGFLSPLLIPLVTSSELSVAWKTTLSGLLMAGIPELFMVITIGILGKEGYQYLKGKVMAFLKKHGPPQKVSRSRYKTGLVMFSIPLLLGLLFPYIKHHFHALEAIETYVHIGGDVLLLISLFVLGGEFWDKIRALFTYSSAVQKAETQG